MHAYLWKGAESGSNEQPASWKGSLQQFGAFTVVGTSNTIIEFAIFNALLWLFGPTRALEITMFSAIAYCGGSANSYRWNRRWTFRGVSPQPYRFWRFIIVYSFALAVNTALVYVFSTALEALAILSTLQRANLSKLMALCGSGMLSFLGNKYWVFNEGPGLTGAQPDSTPQEISNPPQP